MAEFVISSGIEVLEFLLQEKVPHYWANYLKFSVDEKAAILKGSEEPLQGLKADLKIMLDFLIESSRSPNLKYLISQVKEMAHDAGVIIDTFIFIKSEELEAVRLNNFLREIKSIRIRFREVNLQSPVEEEEDDGRRHRGPSWEGEDEDAVGLVGPVKTLIHSFVLSWQRWRFSVMIIGMGGVGKTTLARKLYNHVVVAKRFEYRGWACVSSEFRPEEVLRVLIRQMVKLKKEEEEVMEKMSLRRLKDMLRQHLHGKRYFIVLDGVWDDTSFKHVLFALPREENSSRVLLTCRCKNKVEVVDSTFSLGPLSSDASWQLFLKMVFTNDHKCPRRLEKIGRKIVKMCNGLPLAIEEVGRKLAMKSQTERAWEEFLKSIDFSETIAVLELSYHRLSQELKSCFVLASFFKKGTTISAEKFIHIWIAAGIAMRDKVEGYAEMEMNARKYLDKLSDEYMIIMVYSPIKKELKSLYLDSFHHKISITKAEEEIFLQILGNEEHFRQPCKPRHRVICCSREKFGYSTKQEKHLISLFFHGGGTFDATPSYWESFEQLRILDFEGFGLKSLSERVCALGKLRYLGLRDNYIQELPHTLGCLKNLEVLDIALNFMLEVPDIIWEMDSLHHLYLSDIICRTPLKTDPLKYLQTLTYISADNWTYEVSNLENMTSLRKLGIEELDESSNVSKLFASLAKLKNLQCLILRGFRFRSMPPLDDFSVLKKVYQIKLDGRLRKLPKFHNGIRSLTLVNSCLDVDPMPELEKIFFLSYLKLQNAYTGQEMVFSRQGSRIHTLRIVELWHLRNLRVEKSFSNYLLRKIEICNCPSLNNIPKEMIAFASKCYWEGLKIVTTRKIGKVIRQSEITYKTHVDVQP